MTRVWRPLSGCNNDGIMLDRAEDVYVYDVFSKRYFDANSGLWNVNLGYSNKIIKKAVADQLEKLPFANPLLFYPEAAARLSEKLFSKILKLINQHTIIKHIQTCCYSFNKRFSILLYL